MIVIDLGCYEHEVSRSVEPLVERFRPRILYGFDPLLPKDSKRLLDGTHCVLTRSAAWTREGTVGIERNGTRTRILEDGDEVPCFDLARFIAALPRHERVVLKLDVEGAEYPLLEHLHAQGLDARLTLALVEWHADARVELDCPVEEWTF